MSLFRRCCCCSLRMGAFLVAGYSFVSIVLYTLNYGPLFVIGYNVLSYTINYNICLYIGLYSISYKEYKINKVSKN